MPALNWVHFFRRGSLNQVFPQNLGRFVCNCLNCCFTTSRSYLHLNWFFNFFPPFTVESLSNSVFERRTSTGSGLFASLGSGLVQTLGQIVFIREKKLSNTNLLESRHIKEKKASLPLDVRRSKTSLLKLPIISWARPIRKIKNAMATFISIEYSEPKILTRNLNHHSPSYLAILFYHGVTPKESVPQLLQ